MLIAGTDGTLFHFSDSNPHNVGGFTYDVSLPDYIEDRNGNKIVVTDYMTQTGANRGVFNYTDILGRAVLSSSGFGASGNTISVVLPANLDSQGLIF